MLFSITNFHFAALFRKKDIMLVRFISKDSASSASLGLFANRYKTKLLQLVPLFAPTASGSLCLAEERELL